MKRKDFIKGGLIGVIGITGLGSFFGFRKSEGFSEKEDCLPSPRETKGPFPNKTPRDYVRENIIGDRKGVALEVKFRVLDKSKNCEPMPNALVDIWHCDNKGKYSEYGGMRMQREDLTGKHFLRGRQTTDERGWVSFISIFPGYYPGRAPHIHLEILDNKEKSLLATQIAFPSKVCDSVYETSNYGSTRYTSNESDGIFRSSLKANLIDEISGDVTSGYIMKKDIIVTT